MVSEPPFTISASLRVLTRDGKRVLQQRWTRMRATGWSTAPGDDKPLIQELWKDVPEVTESAPVLTKHSSGV